MPTYNGWNVVTMPATPLAPAALEVMQQNIVGMNRNPFTGQQQTQNWNANWLELSVTMPPMNYTDAQAWVAFLQSLQGVENVFQFTAAICAAYPAETTSSGTPLYFRLKANNWKYSIQPDRYYRFQFEAMHAF